MNTIEHGIALWLALGASGFAAAGAALWIRAVVRRRDRLIAMAVGHHGRR